MGIVSFDEAFSFEDDFRGCLVRELDVVFGLEFDLLRADTSASALLTYWIGLDLKEARYGSKLC